MNSLNSFCIYFVYSLGCYPMPSFYVFWCIRSPARSAWKREAGFSPLLHPFSSTSWDKYYSVNICQGTMLCAIISPWLNSLPVPHSGCPQNLSNPFFLSTYLFPPLFPNLPPPPLRNGRLIFHLIFHIKNGGKDRTEGPTMHHLMIDYLQYNQTFHIFGIHILLPSGLLRVDFSSQSWVILDKLFNFPL